MLPIIGFIVAGYAVVRLMQVPFEFRPTADAKWDRQRYAALIILSAIGVVFVLYWASQLFLRGGGQDWLNSVAPTAPTGRR